MSKKPFYNAVIAAGYITIIASFMNWVSHMSVQPADNLFMPVTMLSLLVLSVAVMAFLFFYQPVLLLLDGKRPEAAKLLLTTIGIFAGLTIVFLVLAMFIIPQL